MGGSWKTGSLIVLESTHQRDVTNNTVAARLMKVSNQQLYYCILIHWPLFLYSFFLKAFLRVFFEVCKGIWIVSLSHFLFNWQYASLRRCGACSQVVFLHGKSVSLINTFLYYGWPSLTSHPDKYEHQQTLFQVGQFPGDCPTQLWVFLSTCQPGDSLATARGRVLIERQLSPTEDAAETGTGLLVAKFSAAGFVEDFLRVHNQSSTFGGWLLSPFSGHDWSPSIIA